MKLTLALFQLANRNYSFTFQLETNHVVLLFYSKYVICCPALKTVKPSDYTKGISKSCWQANSSPFDPNWSVNSSTRGSRKEVLCYEGQVKPLAKETFCLYSNKVFK